MLTLLSCLEKCCRAISFHFLHKIWCILFSPSSEISIGKYKYVEWNALEKLTSDVHFYSK